MNIKFIYELFIFIGKPYEFATGYISPKYRAARQGEPENQNFGFSGLLSHNVAIF